MPNSIKHFRILCSYGVPARHSERRLGDTMEIVGKVYGCQAFSFTVVNTTIVTNFNR
jgi:hypothetical protein